MPAVPAGGGADVLLGQSRRACASASVRSARSRAAAAVDRGERLLDRGGNPQEGQPAVEERGDRDLVGGVEGARIGAAALAGPPREREQRERLEIGRVELERQARGEVEAAEPASPARSGYVSAYEIGTRMSG